MFRHPAWRMHSNVASCNLGMTEGWAKFYQTSWELRKLTGRWAGYQGKEWQHRTHRMEYQKQTRRLKVVASTSIANYECYILWGLF